MFSNQPLPGAQSIVELTIHADGAVAFSFPGPEDSDDNKEGNGNNDSINVLPPQDDDQDVKIVYEYINLD